MFKNRVLNSAARIITKKNAVTTLKSVLQHLFSMLPEKLNFS